MPRFSFLQEFYEGAENTTAEVCVGLSNVLDAGGIDMELVAVINALFSALAGIV